MGSHGVTQVGSEQRQRQGHRPRCLRTSACRRRWLKFSKNRMASDGVFFCGVACGHSQIVIVPLSRVALRLSAMASCACCSDTCVFLASGCATMHSARPLPREYEFLAFLLRAPPLLRLPFFHLHLTTHKPG